MILSTAIGYFLISLTVIRFLFISLMDSYIPSITITGSKVLIILYLLVKSISNISMVKFSVARTTGQGILTHNLPGKI